ncbi:AsmA family protein, partial [Falsiroseomonas sp. CW058]|uniref:AsmA family protein n=1 Tax=Falsiroseomonas sp. CW058 TaxID=3388664 RepID=UPI003D321A50
MTRPRRWPWFLLTAVIAIPAVALAAIWAFLDAERLRPRIVAAVEEATGRRFTIGSLRLALSLSPTVELRDVALANAPGGSRPQMLTAGRVEMQARLLPLLSGRIEIARIELDAPDLLLETDAGGRGNWQFEPAAADPPAAAAPAAPPAAEAPRQPRALGIDRLRVEGGRLTWRDGRTGVAQVVEVPALDASAPLAGPTALRGQAVLRGQTLALDATAGAIAAFGGAEPWPFGATLAAAGAEARVEGTLAAGRAWAVQASARAADLTRLAPLLPEIPLPPLREVTAAAHASGTGAEIAAARDIALRAGASDLSVLRPGLALARFEATAASLDAPLSLAGEATLGGAALRLSGSLGTPAILLGRQAAPLPVELRLETAGAHATLRGAIAEPRALAGVDLALAAEVADLVALSPLAGAPLPAIRDLRATARLAERTARFEGGAHLRGIAVTSSVGDLGGELTLVVGERPGLAGRLASRRIDLDAILAAMPARPAPQPGAPTAAPREPSARVIPDAPLPLGALRTVDADLGLAVEEVALRGAAWRQVAAHVFIEAGRARLAPLTAATPAGPVALEVEADARQDPGALRLVARAPGLDLAALQAGGGRAPPPPPRAAPAAPAPPPPAPPP